MPDIAIPFAFAGAHGVSIAGGAIGPGDGLPVILSPGGGQTRHSWGGVARSLADAGFRAITLDLRGHGDSGWAPPGQGYMLDDYAEDVRAAARLAGRPPLLVGASLGGLASLIAAGEPPCAPIAGLCLVDVSPNLRPRGVAGILGFMRATRDGFDSPADAARAIADYLPHRPPPRDLEGLRKNLRQRENGRYAWHWDPATIDPPLDPDATNPRLQAAAARVAAPALLLRGERSELVTRAVADAFMARFADGRVEDIEGARHMVAGDANNAFGQALCRFAEAIRARETANNG